MEQVHGKLDGGTLRIFLSGHVDSANAAEVEAEICRLREGQEQADLVLDAKELSYISSAGLRIILRLIKTGRPVRMVNVSSDIFEILETTGFSEMMSVEKARRVVSVEGCEVIGRGANGTVYRLNADTIVKMYHDPDALDDMNREREIARKAFVLGIPTAIPYDIVSVGETFGAVFELLNAKSVTKLIQEDPEHIDTYVGMFIDLLHEIHATPCEIGLLPDMKLIALSWAQFLEDHLPRPLWEKLISLIEAVPSHDYVIHGDYHTNNVLVQDGEPLLIDMDTLAIGHPIFELASMYNACLGYTACDDDEINRFFGIPQAITRKVWELSLRRYLGTEDEARLTEVQAKAMVLGLMRVLRRTIRRESGTERGERLIAYCKEKLTELIPAVDTLVF